MQRRNIILISQRFVLSPNETKHITVFLNHQIIARASDPEVFTFSSAARLENECHVIIRSVLDKNNSYNMASLLEAGEALVASDRATVSKLDFLFRKDLTQPSCETKSCIGLFSLDESFPAGDSVHLLLMNDGRIVTPISYMTPLYPALNSTPVWMVPVASPCVIQMHCRVAENIQVIESSVPGSSIHSAAIHLSGSMWQGNPAVLKCAADYPEALDDVKIWAKHMKCLQKKMLQKHRSPLPITARANILQGRFEECGSNKPVKVCLTGEGLLFWEHMKLWAGSQVLAEGSLSIRLSSVFSNDIMEDVPFFLTFSSEQQRNASLLLLNRLIRSLNDDMRWSEAVMNVVNKSISATSVERQKEHDALVSQFQAVGGVPRYLCDLWNTPSKKLLSAIFFCLRDTFADSIFDFPASYTPPVVPLLINAVKQLNERHPEQFNNGIKVRADGCNDKLTYARILKLVNMGLQVEDLDGIEKKFVRVSSRTWYWMMRAFAEAAPASLMAKDGNETFLYRLLFSEKR
jgi:hypothetical protein